MTIRVCVAGVSGHIGKPVAIAVSQAQDMTLVGAVSRNQKGRSTKEVCGEEAADVIISGSVAEALKTPTDVLLDFTSADAVKGNVIAAIERGVHVVIASSGLTDQDYLEVDALARKHKVGALASGNLTLTALLLRRFACEAAKYVSQWEIIDYAYDGKRDSPSGTARELAFRMSQVRKPELTRPVAETVGVRETRGATMNGMQVHSVRLPGISLSIEVVLGAKAERLTIRHDDGGRHEPYIGGALLATRKVRDNIGLTRGLDKALGFPDA